MSRLDVTSCPFCEPPAAQVFLRDGPCYAMWTGGRPQGSAMVLPVAHRLTPFDLLPDEWEASLRLMRTVRAEVERLHAPAGWNVGWNVHPVGGQSIPHAHCHVIPRYADEPYAGRGLRWWIKSAANNAAVVEAVCTSDQHELSKHPVASITLLAGIGVEGDAHAGPTVQHRSRVAADPRQPNLRQVHLMQSELHDELRESGLHRVA